jgi:hypothetical protein
MTNEVNEREEFRRWGALFEKKHDRPLQLASKLPKVPVGITEMRVEWHPCSDTKKDSLA